MKSLHAAQPVPPPPDPRALENLPQFMGKLLWYARNDVSRDKREIYDRAYRVIAALHANSTEALTPFAEAAANIPADVEDFKLVAHVPGGHNADAFRRMSANLTAGNLRRAASALPPPLEEPNDDDR